ncbi:hypothetical protein HUW51_10170 [Adhaeribacter swui]|uniref:Uncharacterized protein n=1 Tax=Adhaeribacter swui TaxID=2086471 RepID=A0A7G7G7E3_9BACT|nr:hypothetical protein [Adhaeribacter swui]QNF33077.1 hypothetical protein HUW51_10170 [Adhaeribacter swui]
MAKIQLDLPEEVHFEVKEQQLKIEKETKKRASLKDVYEIVIRKGLEVMKAQNNSK